MAKRKINIWDLLTYVAFGIIILYSFLKVLGYIKSPITLDIAFLSSVFYILGKYTMKIDYIAKDSRLVHKQIEHINSRLKRIEKTIFK